MVEIVRIDIVTEVSMMSSHNAYPFEGHFETVLHMMGYLKGRHNYRLAMEPKYPTVNEYSFKTQDWSQQYGNIKEAIPINAPLPRGNELVLRMMADSDHLGDDTDRRSHTGYMIFVNMALIYWLSKKQATVEKAVFGSEFVAMTHGFETLRGLCYKLRMMGVFIDGPTYVYGDNMYVIFNISRPESQLKNKSNSV